MLSVLAALGIVIVLRQMRSSLVSGK